ncbi:GNAT family N-acetyltransferase [Galbitalea soli]|uniref:GNAT family N-acetyltransferase n=1 Tax=Galbitalea soli TaxID=1268042 RepID=A0A7C9PPM5_9MICO|nr:GNAT family protein [Galbitalea soli]NEM92445.1 GNAT family N-acetyltransferase [Galbitalea soli]NYJ29480.1 RimJ/RimL family protein N-acetyltransferase [Galbitalea soli]
MALPTDLALPYEFAAPLVTERLRLRPQNPGDLEDVHAYQSRDDVCRYLLYEPRTREQLTEKLTAHEASVILAVDGDYVQLAMELPGTPSLGDPQRPRVIGDLYFTIASVENSKAEIGWTLHPDFHGQGYAAEAARAVLDLAFGRMRLHRVVAELDPRNDASIALCRRLGMREEAFFAKDLWFKGAWADTGMYAILDSEWAARA